MIGTLNITTTDAQAVPVSITVNGQVHQATVPAHRLLVDFLREDLGLTGTKVGCETGQCGACTILLDGVSVKGCTVLAAQADGANVTTIEGLATNGALTRVQTALWEEHGVQCGYCTPAMVLAMTDLLSTQSETERARDPQVDGRHHLPLRRVPERRPRHPDPHLTRFHRDDDHYGDSNPGLRDQASRRPRVPSRRVEVHRRHHPAGDDARRHPAQPASARAHQGHRRHGRLEDAGRRPRLHRRGPRRQDDADGLHLEAGRCREPLRAAPVRAARLADGPGHRQGPLRGRVGRRRRRRDARAGVCRAAGHQGRLRDRCRRWRAPRTR